MAHAPAALPALPALLAFVHRLCDLSERIALKGIAKHGGATQKDDASPVTEIDRRIEHALRKEIEKTFPEHGVVGEEFGVSDGASPYGWIIDPIDGTLSFMAGRPLYGTLICFASHGVPHIGVINQPDLKRRWIGVAGKKSLCNGAVLRTSGVSRLGEAMLATTSPDFFSPPELEAFARVRSQARYAVYGGNCIDYAMLAQGNVDLVIEAGLKCFDVAALMPIVKAAGGVMTDWNGRGINLRDARINVIAAANHKLHAEALAALRGEGVA